MKRIIRTKTLDITIIRRSVDQGNYEALFWTLGMLVVILGIFALGTH